MRTPQAEIRNPKLYSYIDSTPALAAEGPLAGKTAVIQPNMSVRDWPCEAASAALENFRPLETATLLERLQNAGTRIVGCSRMAELGFGLTNDTTAMIIRNGECDLALVTDTMGETRQVAALAGVLGFKPTYGILSRHGLIGLAPSLESFGIVAANTQDLAAVMNELTGIDTRDPCMRRDTPPDFTKIDAERDSVNVVGIIPEMLDALVPAEKNAFQNALSQLESRGIRIEELAMHDVDLFKTVHNVVAATEASSSAGKYDSVRYGHRAEKADNWNEMYLKSRAESFGLLVKSFLFQGTYFQFENYPAFENATRIRRHLIKQCDTFFEKVDVLAWPTRLSSCDALTASTVDDVYDAFALTLPANVTGQPAITLPGIVINGDVDLGLQLTGPTLGDARLLAFAAKIMNS